MITYSTVIPADPDAAELLFKLKGAPLSCLVGLYLCHPTPVGHRVLKTITGYKKDAITAAMNLLVDLFRLATRVGRTESWGLTDKGVQLRLPFFGALFKDIPARAAIEGDFSALEPSSSSGLVLNQSNESFLKTTTTEGGKTALEANAFVFPERALEILAGEWFDGCPKTLRERAVQTALERGDDLAVIEYRALAWMLYTQTPAGRSIRARAIFTARKIQEGERCPEFLDRVDSDWRRARRDPLARLQALSDEIDAAYDAEEDDDAPTL